MTSPEAPPETSAQRRARETWTMLRPHDCIGWGRDKHGRFHAELARHLESFWIAAVNSAKEPM